jgi:hypothetical protein
MTDQDVDDDEESTGMDQNAHDAFVRWQSASIAQLGFVNNLLILLAGGMMTLEAGAVLDKLDSIGMSTKNWLLCSLVLLAVSIALGLWLAMNRLYSIRYTAQIARGRQKLRHADELSQLRRRTRGLDSITWRLLWSQMVPFLLGAGALLCAVCIQLTSTQLK